MLRLRLLRAASQDTSRQSLANRSDGNDFFPTSYDTCRLECPQPQRATLFGRCHMWRLSTCASGSNAPLASTHTALIHAFHRRILCRACHWYLKLQSWPIAHLAQNDIVSTSSLEGSLLCCHVAPSHSAAHREEVRFFGSGVFLN